MARAAQNGPLGLHHLDGAGDDPALEVIACRLLGDPQLVRHLRASQRVVGRALRRGFELLAEEGVPVGFSVL